MSYTLHHAIIVTARYDASISLPGQVPHGIHWAEHAREKALDIFGDGQVSEIVNPWLNNVRSFFIGPDGSNDGREESDVGDKQREQYIAWLRDQSYGPEDGSPLTWVVVQYGAEDGEQPAVIASDWEDQDWMSDGESE